MSYSLSFKILLSELFVNTHTQTDRQTDKQTNKHTLIFMCVCVGVRENNKDLSKTAEHKLVTIKCCHIQIFVFSLSDIVCTVLGKCIECVVFMLYLLLKANK